MDTLPHAIRRFLADEPYRQLTPDELWLRFRDHAEEGALRVLLERVGGRIYARCKAVVGDDPTADEAFQETFVELYRWRAKLPTYGAALAWLYVTATNKARAQRRWWRRVWRRDRVRAEAAPTAAPPPDDAAHEQAELVHRALTRLPERERRAVELVYLEGMTHEQAAAVLGLDRGSVGKYVERGLTRLRTKLVLKGGAALVALGVASRTGVLALDPRLLDRLAASVFSPPVATGQAALLGGRAGRTALFVGLLSGAVAGGLAWRSHLAHTPTPQVAIPPQTPVVTLESVPDRNLRIFHAEVAPRIAEALRALVAPDGEVALETAQSLDTRIECIYRVRLGPQAATWVDGASKFTHDAETRTTQVFFTPDRVNAHRVYREIDKDRPIVLWRHEFTKWEWTVRLEQLDKAVAAFVAIPTDDLTTAEGATFRQRLRTAFQPYLGTWYFRGDPDRPCQIDFREGAPYLLTFDKYIVNDPWRFRITPDGRPQGEWVFNSQVEFARDGKRIDFVQTGNWWTREPLPGGR